MDILSLPSFLWTKQPAKDKVATEEEMEVTNSSTTTTNSGLPDDPTLLRVNTLLCRTSSSGAGGNAPCPDYLSVERYPAASGDCRRNLVQSLHMDILHSGLAGIQAVDAYIELVNMASTVQCN